jgi:hypothetical protein
METMPNGKSKYPVRIALSTKLGEEEVERLNKAYPTNTYTAIETPYGKDTHPFKNILFSEELVLWKLREEFRAMQRPGLMGDIYYPSDEILMRVVGARIEIFGKADTDFAKVRGQVGITVSSDTIFMGHDRQFKVMRIDEITNISFLLAEFEKTRAGSSFVIWDMLIGAFKKDIPKVILKDPCDGKVVEIDGKKYSLSLVKDK